MKKALTVTLATLLVVSLSACAEDGDSGSDGGGGETTNGIKSGLKIAFLPKQVNNPYFTSAGTGGKAAVGEFKGTYSETGPSEASPSAQVSYINTLSQQDTDVIVVSANDKDAICGALTEAKSGGTKVVTFDSDTKPECRDVFVNQATADGIAKSQIKLISEAVGAEGGKIAILSATANATNQNAWIEKMKTELAKPEYSKLQLVATVYGDDNDQKSFQEAQGLLAKYPDLKGIISPTTVQGQGGAHRSRHAEPDARVREGRHLQGVRVVEPGGAGLPGRVRGGRVGVGHDHRQAGRQVHRRQAR
ncbi:hypothetical protein GCM10009557_61580 [Virgisporangium ochraceum]